MYDNRKIWLGGKIIPVTEATINVLSPTAQFGANVFEGIRCYWNADHGHLYAFRLDDHYRRLHQSVSLLRINSPYSTDDLTKALIDVVKANGYREDIAVRQTIFVDGLGGTWSSREPVNMFVAPIPRPRKPFSEKRGLRCQISSWQRISDNNLSPRAKVGANYINSRNAQLDALQNGYDSAIFLNSQGKVAEGPGSCIFIIRDGQLITPPCTASVLESITRDTIIRIAQEELGLTTVERDIDRTELYICDEAFLCGSAMEVMPVTEVDGYKIGNAAWGDITSRLAHLYLQAVTGESTRHPEWLTKINE